MKVKFIGHVFTAGFTFQKIYEVLQWYSTGDYLVIDDNGRKRVMYKDEAQQL
jgi:hypothetical protein